MTTDSGDTCCVRAHFCGVLRRLRAPTAVPMYSRSATGCRACSDSFMCPSAVNSCMQLTYPRQSDATTGICLCLGNIINPRCHRLWTQRFAARTSSRSCKAFGASQARHQTCTIKLHRIMAPGPPCKPDSVRSFLHRHGSSTTTAFSSGGLVRHCCQATMYHCVPGWYCQWCAQLITSR